MHRAKADDLLDRFITQECTPYIRRLLEQAIANSAIARPRFEFNLFEITIDRGASQAIIEDVLDASDAGTQRVPIAEFMAALARCAG